MADQWLHMYHQNHLPNNQLLSDHNSGLVSDSTVVTTATASNPDGISRVAKPVRKRSRASRRTPTTLLNTDPANFRAMVQQFTGGPSSNANNSPNYAVFDPTTVAAYNLAAPPQQPPLFQFQSQSPPPMPPFMFSALGNSAASEAAFFQPTLNGGSRSNNTNVDYMGLFDGSSPAA